MDFTTRYGYVTFAMLSVISSLKLNDIIVYYKCRALYQGVEGGTLSNSTLCIIG